MFAVVSLLTSLPVPFAQVRLPLSLTVIGCPPLIVDHRVDHSDAPAPVGTRCTVDLGLHMLYVAFCASQHQLLPPVV